MRLGRISCGWHRFSRATTNRVKSVSFRRCKISRKRLNPSPEVGASATQETKGSRRGCGRWMTIAGSRGAIWKLQEAHNLRQIVNLKAPLCATQRSFLSSTCAVELNWSHLSSSRKLWLTRTLPLSPMEAKIAHSLISALRSRTAASTRFQRHLARYALSHTRSSEIKNQMKHLTKRDSLRSKRTSNRRNL